MIEHFAIGVAIGACLTWLAFRLARRTVPDEPDYGLRDPRVDALAAQVREGRAITIVEPAGGLSNAEKTEVERAIRLMLDGRAAEADTILRRYDLCDDWGVVKGGKVVDLFCDDCGPVADVGHHPDCRRAAA
jgi:hypothetical protein